MFLLISFAFGRKNKTKQPKQYNRYVNWVNLTTEHSTHQYVICILSGQSSSLTTLGKHFKISSVINIAILKVADLVFIQPVMFAFGTKNQFKIQIIGFQLKRFRFNRNSPLFYGKKRPLDRKSAEKNSD